MKKKKVPIANIKVSEYDRQHLLRAHAIIGSYDVNDMTDIIHKSTKTIYRDMKKKKKELFEEFKALNFEINEIELQSYINFVYKYIYYSVEQLTPNQRQSIVETIIRNLNENYKVKIKETKKVKLEETLIEVGVKEKMIYVNKYYNHDGNIIFFNETKITNLVNDFIEILNSKLNIYTEDKIFKELKSLFEKKWISYTYNILEEVADFIVEAPSIVEFIKSFFKSKGYYINDKEAININEVVKQNLEIEKNKSNKYIQDIYC